MLMSREDFKSFIPAEKTIPELTLKAVLVGAMLAVILGSANAYLGLYAGMTVSAVIPGAVMAFAVMRAFKPTILEVNLGMMGAAAGEALAAGVIFTIPALVVLNRMGFGGWEFIHYPETTVIALIGGVLGVLWMVPLRRALIIKTDLPFPEGIAVAAVLTTTVGETESKGSKSSKKNPEEAVSAIWMIFGVVVAALFKFGQVALNIFRGMIHRVVQIGKYAIFGEAKEGYFYGGVATSPALLAVGWIIGPRIASFVFVGGLIGWVIIAPLIALSLGLPTPPLSDPEILSRVLELGGGNLELGKLIWGFFQIWGEQIRYIGVGAMVVGGLWTIWTLRSNLSAGIKEAIAGIRGGETTAKSRTDKDLSYKKVFLIIGLLTIPIFLIYVWLSQLWAVSLLMAVFAVGFAFIASAIAGYMAGLLGSSNNPISGVTIAVLLIVSLILLGLGVTGATGGDGMVVAIGIAAVICCAAAISGDVLQSLACGQMVGATPRNQQIAELIGVICAAPVLAIIISALDGAYGIGTPNLPAPQSFLMAGIVKGVLGGEMLWPYVLAGAVLAFVLILIDLPVLPVAIGIYLPFTLVVPIFIGGTIRHVSNKIIKKEYGEEKEEEKASDWELAIKKTGVKPREKIVRCGLLLSAGLIAGEALMGVIVAFLIIGGIDLSVFAFAPAWPALLIFGLIIGLLFYIPMREILVKKKLF